MTICYFGNYQKDYPRNQTLISGLRQNNCQVLECQTREWGIKKYWSLYRQHRQIKNKYDFLIVAFQGHSLVWFAKLISSKPIIFDAFVSLYLANVEDRQLYSPQSIKAKYYAWLDRISCQLADKVLLDTQTQINYFIKKYRIKKDKFERIFVGANNDTYYPDSRPQTSDSKFIVHWHGYIVPFYAVDIIIKAAHLLQKHADIQFRLVTRFNNKYKIIKDIAAGLKLTNLKFYSETPHQELAKLINRAHICLGIFGNNKKAELVIPNKVIEALACKKAVITADTAAMHELFKDKENILLCQPNNPADLVTKILSLKNDINLRNSLADRGYQLYLNQLTPKILGKQLKDLLKKYE